MTKGTIDRVLAQKMKIWEQEKEDMREGTPITGKRNTVVAKANANKATKTQIVRCEHGYDDMREQFDVLDETKRVTRNSVMY